VILRNTDCECNVSAGCDSQVPGVCVRECDGWTDEGAECKWKSDRMRGPRATPTLRRRSLTIVAVYKDLYS
jgi:hypothetical protein